jgi:hypothetical protein
MVSLSNRATRLIENCIDLPRADPARLEEHLSPLNAPLTAAEIDLISAVLPIGAAAGTRYPEGGMRGVYI